MAAAALAACALLLLSLVPAAAAAAPTSTPLSSTVVLAVPSDYLLDGSGRSVCIDIVERAAAQQVPKVLQFVPTLFWVDTGGAGRLRFERRTALQRVVGREEAQHPALVIELQAPPARLLATTPPASLAPTPPTF